MGLFGGFKAKFSKDSVAKNESKNNKKNDVVCLGYRVFSEFDTQQQPHESSRAIKPPSPVRNHTSVNLNESTTNVKTSSLEHQSPVIAKPKVKKNLKKTSTETETSNVIANGIVTSEFIEVEPKTEVKANKHNDAEYIEGKTSTFNPPTTNTLHHKNKVVKKTAPKSILKAKSSSKLRDYNSTESENHLGSLDNINNIGLKADNAIVDRRDRSTSNETLSTESIKYSKSTRTTSGSFVSQVSTQIQKSGSTYTNDGASISTSVSQAKVDVSQTRGIGNTSNVAASLFFADDDDDDYEDNDGANRRSVEC